MELSSWTFAYGISWGKGTKAAGHDERNQQGVQASREEPHARWKTLQAIPRWSKFHLFVGRNSRYHQWCPRLYGLPQIYASQTTLAFSPWNPVVVFIMLRVSMVARSHTRCFWGWCPGSVNGLELLLNFVSFVIKGWSEWRCFLPLTTPEYFLEACVDRDVDQRLWKEIIPVMIS